MDPEELPDYIFNELLSASKLYHDDKSLKKVSTFNLHLNDDIVLRSAVSVFLNKVKGVIRRDECAYLKVEGPFYVDQTCFLSGTDHKHIQILVTTKYDDSFTDL